MEFLRVNFWQFKGWKNFVQIYFSVDKMMVKLSHYWLFFLENSSLFHKVRIESVLENMTKFVPKINPKKSKAVKFCKFFWVILTQNFHEKLQAPLLSSIYHHLPHDLFFNHIPKQQQNNHKKRWNLRSI